MKLFPKLTTHRETVGPLPNDFGDFKTEVHLSRGKCHYLNQGGCKRIDCDDHDGAKSLQLEFLI